MNPIEQIEVVDLASIVGSIRRSKHAHLWEALDALPVGKCLKVPPMGRKDSERIQQGAISWYRRKNPKMILHVRNTPEASYLWLGVRNDL